MNLYKNNNEDENKGGAPLLARGSAPFKKTSLFGRAPMLSRAASGIVDRLKNLSRKDMAFVTIGLGVLVTVPVSEYMMTKPSADNQISSGFGSRDGAAAAGLYEPGINALGQGSADGSGEVITPLSARDPASLILGSQSAQPPVTSAPPPDMGMRDSMKESGRAAFSAAAQSAGAPTPIPRMQAALRGVSSFFGGGEGSRTAGSLSGKAIIDDAKSASSKAAQRAMVGPVATPGYRGVASNTPNSASKGALDSLRNQAGKAASNFSGSSAMGSLDKAAADSVMAGPGGGEGAGEESDRVKHGSNSNTKNSHSSSGETLTQQARKMRQQKALEWEFFKKYEIPKQIINSVLTGFTGSLTKFVGGITDDLTGQSYPTSYCWQPAVCPTGDCAAEVAKRNLVAPVDLCHNPGASKFSWESAGKEKASGGQALCICGKANKPIGKEYASGGSAGPVAPIVDPATGSNQLSQLVTDYDAVLQDMVNTVVKAEQLLAEKQPITNELASLKGAFSNLNAKAGGFKNLLSNYGTKAQNSVSAYSKAVTQANASFGATRDMYRDYAASIAALREAIRLNQVRPREDLAQGVKAVLPAESMAKILAAVDEAQPGIDRDYSTADRLLGVHKTRLNAYSGQLAEIDKGIVAIENAHALIEPAVKAINPDGILPAAEELRKITGRPEENTAPTPSNDSIRDAVGIPVVAPLKQAASDLRGLDWKILWAEGHKFDTTVTAKAETSVWDAFDSKINKGEAATLGAPINFVSNFLRGNEIRASVVAYGADFSNIEAMATLAMDKMTLTKGDIIGLGVNPCYFDGTCGGNQPVTPQVETPVVPPGAAAPTQQQLAEDSDGLISQYKSRLATAKADFASLPDKSRVAAAYRAGYEGLKVKAGESLAKMEAGLANVEQLKLQLAKPDLSSSEIAAIKQKLDVAKLGYESAANEFAVNMAAARKFASDHPATGTPAVRPPLPQPVPVSEPESPFCYKTAAGCASVQGFYLERKWQVRKQKVAVIVYTEANGAEGMVWDRLYNRYAGQKLTDAQRHAVCAEAWSGNASGVTAWARAVIFNFDWRGRAARIKACEDEWFDAEFEIQYENSGQMHEAGHIVDITATQQGSGNSSGRRYVGSGQLTYNVYLQFQCAIDSAAQEWRTTMVKARVDKPATMTYSNSVNFSAGPSLLKLGAGVSQGVNRSISFGSEMTELTFLKGIPCGSAIDGKNR